MKKFILIALILFVSIQSFSQKTNPSPTLIQQNYLQKSKNQKKAAWILLISGTVLTSIGSVILVNATVNEWASLFSTEPTSHSSAIGTILFCTSTVSMVASIPLFIIASKNKKKTFSASSSFQMETAPQILNRSFTYKSYPALSLKTNL